MSVVGSLSVSITGDPKGLKDALSESAKSVATWSAASIAAAAAATAAFVKMGIDSADATYDLSKQLGTTSKDLMIFQRAADLAGVSQSQMESATRTLALNLGKAATGSGAASDSLARLGLTANQLSAMPLADRMAKINQSIEEMIPAAERASVAADLFGQRGALAMAQISTENITDATSEINKFNAGLSAVDAERVGLASDSFGRAGVAITSLSESMAAKFGPVIAATVDAMLDAAASAGVFETGAKKAFDIVIAGAEFAINAVDGLKRVFELVADWIVVAFTAIASVIGGVIRNILEAASVVPGVDFSDSIAAIKEFESQSDGIINEAWSNMDATLSKPMAGDAFRKFVEDAEVAGQAAAEAAAAAQERAKPEVAAGPSVADTAAADELAKLKDALAQRLIAIQEAQMSESELASAKYSADREALLEAMANEVGDRENNWLLLEELEVQHNENLARIAEDAAKKEAAIEDAKNKAMLASRQQFFTNMSSLMNTSSKTLFGIGQKFAIADAGIKGAGAVMDAWAAGMKTGGPWAPVVAAGYAAAAAISSANLINNIKSQSFGGGGGGGAAAIGQGSSGVAAPAGAAGSGGGAASTQELRVSGIDSGSLFTGDMVRGLANELLEFQRNGGQVILA